VELLEVRPGLEKNGPMVVGEGEDERGPLARAEGKTDLAAPGIEVEGPVGGDQERVMDVGCRGGEPLANATTVSLPEGKRDFGGASGVLIVHAALSGGALGERDEGTAGGEPAVGGGSDGLIDEEAEVAEEQEERSRKGVREWKGQSSAAAHSDGVETASDEGEQPGGR
jgi:hypothetical protein